MNDAAERAAERIRYWVAGSKSPALEPACLSVMTDIIREELARDAPKWTSERPTEPGYYWTRSTRSGSLDVISLVLEEIDVGLDRLQVQYCGTEITDYLVHEEDDPFDPPAWLTDPSTEWSGPIKPPE